MAILACNKTARKRINHHPHSEMDGNVLTAKVLSVNHTLIDDAAIV